MEPVGEIIEEVRVRTGVNQGMYGSIMIAQEL